MHQKQPAANIATSVEAEGLCLLSFSVDAIDEVVRTGDLLQHRLQQGGRQVVDAVVAEVLENVQGNGLARPRKAADDNQAQLAWHVISAPLINAS